MPKPTIKSAQRRTSSSRQTAAERGTWDGDILAVSIPTTAFTLDGFRAWSTSEDFPEFARISYLGSELYVEVDLEGDAVEVPITAGTLEGFRAWATSKHFPQRGRISFLGQEILIDMSPENLDWHTGVKTEISFTLVGVTHELDHGRFFGDGATLSNAVADLSTVPDGVFATWEALESGRVQMLPARGRAGGSTEWAGTPDWVMEVVSSSSVHKDTKVLREKYHRAGIPEYWLIDVRGGRISFQILRHRPTGYVAVTPRGGWHKSSVFGRSFRLEGERDRMGRWQFRLLVKPA